GCWPRPAPRLPGRCAPSCWRSCSDAAPHTLHLRAHALAGRALVVAASRADTAAAILAAERMDAHTAAMAAATTPPPADASGTTAPTPAPVRLVGAL
ncbi:SCO4983 family protein, partial [Streptomyces sp. NPDC005069]